MTTLNTWLDAVRISPAAELPTTLLAFSDWLQEDVSTHGHGRWRLARSFAREIDEHPKDADLLRGNLWRVFTESLRATGR